MSTDMIMTYKQEFEELGEFIAQAVISKIAPAKDEMTRRQVWRDREFGATWLKYHEDRNHVKGRRKGSAENSPIIYSRAELMALKEAEKRGAQIVRRTTSKTSKNL